MNRAAFAAQANQMFGNNIMNPQQQKWMDKPGGDQGGLSYLMPLDSLLAKQVVSLTESMNCYTNIRRYEKLFFYSDDRIC